MIELSKILNLKKGEGKIVIFPMIYSFFIGAALAFFVTSVTSLFLSSFEREFLPISFIAAGILVWLIGKILNYLQKILQFSKSLPAGLGFLFITIIVLLIVFRLFEYTVIIFLLYAWIRVFAYIHAVTFWSLAGRLFSLQQAKRVFGLITGGEVLASIIGFFSIPLLLKFLETSDILLVSGSFLALGFLFLLIIVRKFKPELSVKKSIKNIEKDDSLSFKKSKYYRLIFLIAFIPIFAQFFVDFIFQAQAKVEFPDREELTSFVGVFFGLSAIVEFVLKTFASGRLMNQYGVKFGLLAFPVVLLISFFLASVFGLFFGAAGIFFSFVTLGRLFTRAVRTSFNDPATQILYQPLPKEQRLLIQNKIESGPKAYASIVAGLILLGFDQIPNISLVVFSILLFGVTIYWIRSGNETFKEYKIKIQSVLKIAKTEKSHSSFEKIMKYLEQQKISIPGINMLKKTAVDNTVKKYKLSELVLMANSKDKQQRIIAAHELSRYSIYKTEKLFVKLLNDDDFDVRCQSIIAVGENKHSELFEYLLYNFKLNAYREVVFQAILKIGKSILPEIIKIFSTFDYDTNIQLKIIDLIEKIHSPAATEFLKKQINHHNRIIKDKVFNALSNMEYNVTKSEALKANILLEEKINSYVYLANSVLDLQEINSYNTLLTALEEKKNRQKNVVFVILSVLYDKKAIDLIKNNLDNGDENARGFALEVADTVIPEFHKQLLLPFFEGDTNHEIVRRYRFDFPQEKLTFEERLIDIVNTDISITGSLVKVEAIKLLSDFPNEKVKTVLKANIVHPIEYIREVAAFVLFQIDEKEFDETILLNKTKKKFLHDLNDKIKVSYNQGNMLIYEKIELLKSLPDFEILDFNNLFLLAGDCKEQVIHENESIILDTQSQSFGFIVISGVIENSGFMLERGNIIIPHFFEYSNLEIKALEQSLILKVPFYNLNTIIFNNYEFAENIIKTSIKKTA
ncbi:MAG: hypothetical protein JXL97_13780 [Bacteroidales bacterium]|nr:hypothetical protein [Bacteroidales bacterium]